MPSPLSSLAEELEVDFKQKATVFCLPSCWSRDHTAWDSYVWLGDNCAGGLSLFLEKTSLVVSIPVNVPASRLQRGRQKAPSGHLEAGGCGFSVMLTQAPKDSAADQGGGQKQTEQQHSFPSE